MPGPFGWPLRLKQLAAAPTAKPPTGATDVHVRTDGIPRLTDSTGTESLLPPFLFVRKTADTTKNNSAVIADDPHLTLAVAANATYLFNSMIFYSSASQTPDIALRFTGPAGCTAVWVPGGSTPANTGQDTAQLAAQIRLSTVGSGTSRSVGTMNATLIATPQGILRTAGTAGNLVFAWAQNTATVEDTKVLTDSYMIAFRVA